MEHTGLKVSNLYIAQVKEKCGSIERKNYNKAKSDNKGATGVAQFPEEELVRESVVVNFATTEDEYNIKKC